MGDWSHLIVSFRWPHQALVVGYELWDATEKDPFVTLKIHLVFISLVFEFGYGDYPDE
jgi:hypothetical protein